VQVNEVLAKDVNTPVVQVSLFDAYVPIEVAPANIVPKTQTKGVIETG